MAKVTEMYSLTIWRPGVQHEGVGRAVLLPLPASDGPTPVSALAYGGITPVSTSISTSLVFLPCVLSPNFPLLLRPPILMN